jgi:hypothetical protein
MSDNLRVHGSNCDQAAILQGDHTDYLIDGPCDDHEKIALA